MDFRSLLQSFNTISEAEGKVHKGTYGTSYGKEDVRDQYGHKVGKIDKETDNKKDEPKRGRGRPPKTGEHSASPEEKAKAKSREKAGQELQSLLVGKKPKGFDKKKGTEYGLSAKEKAERAAEKKKSSLKEYFEEVSSAKQLDEMMPQQPIPVVGKQGKIGRAHV